MFFQRFSLAIALVALTLLAMPAFAEEEPGDTPTVTFATPKGGDVELYFYGFAKLDVWYDSRQTMDGERARWVLPDSGATARSEQAITAQFSRIGFLSRYQATREWQASGRLEFDFNSGDKPEAMNPRLLNFYGAVQYRKDFMVLGGQWWDLFGRGQKQGGSLNAWRMFFSGNTGLRAPKLAIGNYDIPHTGLVWGAAIARNIGDTYNNEDTGRFAEYPQLQAHVGYRMPFMGKFLEVLLSGVIGQEKFYGSGVGGEDETFDVWGVAFTFFLPMPPNVTIRGEIYTGANLNQFRSGQGYGVYINGGDPTLNTEIASMGGMLNLAITTFKKAFSTQINTGAGIDSIDPEDVQWGATRRTQTWSAYVNVRYFITPQVFLAVEFQRLQTHYGNGTFYEDNRVMMTMRYDWN